MYVSIKKQELEGHIIIHVSMILRYLEKEHVFHKFTICFEVLKINYLCLFFNLSFTGAYFLIVCCIVKNVLNTKTAAPFYTFIIYYIYIFTVLKNYAKM